MSEVTAGTCPAGAPASGAASALSGSGVPGPGAGASSRERPGRWKARPGFVRAVPGSLSILLILLTLLGLLEGGESLALALSLGAGAGLILTGYLMPARLGLLRMVFAILPAAPLGGLLGIAKAIEPHGNSMLLNLCFILIHVVALCVVNDLLLTLGATGRGAANTDIRRRRSAPRVLAVGMTGFLLVLAAGAAWQAADSEEAEVLSADIGNRTIRRLEEEYPHWKDAPADARQLLEKYAESLGGAWQECSQQVDPCLPSFRVLRDMLAELKNGHTEVRVHEDHSLHGLRIKPVEGLAVITVVGEGSPAEAAGIERGMVVHEIGGAPVEQVLRQVPPWQVAYASERSRRYRAYMALPSGPPGPLTLTVGHPGEPRRVVTIERLVIHWDEADDDRDEDDWIQGERLPEGIGYIVIEGFRGRTLPWSFDRELEALMDLPALIVDVRNNGGGQVSNLNAILGRLFDRPIRLGDSCYPVEHDESGDVSLCEEEILVPRGTAYGGIVALLIDECSVSAADVFAYALCRTGRALCFGRPTAGETDSVGTERHAGVSVAISTSAFHPYVGPPVFGAGVEPHVPVEWTIADVRHGRDPDLMAAKAWLLERIASRRTPPNPPARRAALVVPPPPS